VGFTGCPKSQSEDKVEQDAASYNHCMYPSLPFRKGKKSDFSRAQKDL